MRVFGRLVVILVITGAGGLWAVVAMAGGLFAGGPSKAKRFGCRALVHTLQALGPTFVKFAQTSSTRRDTLPPALADELQRLHDTVRPMSRRRAGKALREAGIDAFAEVGTVPTASGSIACVYRGVLTDGRVVAVKLKRPGIGPRMRADLELLQRAVRTMQRMPRMRGMPMADLVGYVGQAILGQLDFAREARNIQRLRDCLAPMPQIRVPAVFPELCTPNCLIFEYLSRLDTATPDALPADVREHLAGRVLQAAAKMMFSDGFVHCDPHPGNIYLTRDQRVVILDAGYCVQLPDRVRDLIGEFFGCLARGDGERCGEIVLESAVDATTVQREAFVADMAAVVGELAGEAGFDMKVFGDEVFRLQQKHGIYARSEFAFPLMAMNTLDGTVRRLADGVDFRRVGVTSGA
jgi:ubiquinone biosynthesis protein